MPRRRRTGLFVPFLSGGRGEDVAVIAFLSLTQNAITPALRKAPVFDRDFFSKRWYRIKALQ